MELSMLRERRAFRSLVLLYQIAIASWPGERCRSSLECGRCCLEGAPALTRTSLRSEESALRQISALTLVVTIYKVKRAVAGLH